MHQIVCRLGLCSRPHWGSLQRSPRPSSWFRGGAPGEREGWSEGEKEGGDGNGGEGVLECPNPELTRYSYLKWLRYIAAYTIGWSAYQLKGLVGWSWRPACKSVPALAAPVVFVTLNLNEAFIFEWQCHCYRCYYMLQLRTSPYTRRPLDL